MLRKIGKKHKILNSIIVFNFVNMMNLFYLRKITTDVLFHYKTVLTNIPIFSTKGMVGLMGINVSLRRFIFPSFPLRVRFGGLTFFKPCSSRIRLRMSHFSPTNLRAFFSFIPSWFSNTGFAHIFDPFLCERWSFSSFSIRRFVMANLRTKLPFSTIRYKFFVALQAFFYHITSKTKAAFGGLKETVKFLHLLAAKLDAKNPFPSDTFSIAY